MDKDINCSMQILVSKNAYRKLQIIKKVSGIDKNSTCIKCVIFNQIEYYKKNEGKFKDKLKGIQIVKRESDLGNTINFSFPDNIKKEITKIKKFCYPFGMDKSITDKDFVYKMILMGLNNIMPNEKYFRDNSERLAENVYSEHKDFIKKFNKIKNPKFDEKNELGISMTDTAKWTLMMIAFEIEWNKCNEKSECNISCK